ncbi:MAG: hypothetical protein J6X76_01390 [Bacteroidaceae bacterium]|nr:hypothetical protein [Bacteroidaceae bacterium]
MSKFVQCTDIAPARQSSSELGSALAYSQCSQIKIPASHPRLLTESYILPREKQKTVFYVFLSGGLKHAVVVASGVTVAVKLAFKDRVMLLGTNAPQERQAPRKGFLCFFLKTSNEDFFVNLQTSSKRTANEQQKEQNLHFNIIFLKKNGLK